MRYHRPDQWREEEKEDQLHLSNEARLRMGRCCVEYFKALYGITPCLAASKEEGMKKRKGKERKKETSFHGKFRKLGMKDKEAATDTAVTVASRGDQVAGANSADTVTEANRVGTVKEASR